VPSSTPPAEIEISLVICTRNRAAQLPACLDHVRALVCGSAWEIVIVDNGSTDGTADLIAAFQGAAPAPVRYVFEQTPGLGRARNAGVRAAAGRVIAFTDDDCYVQPDFLSETLRAFEDPRLGFVTGRVELHDPSDIPVTINPSRTPKRFAGKGYLPTDEIMGANFAFRAETLSAIGGFSDDMGAGTPFAAEDVDAAARALAAGWQGAYDPDIVVRHHHGRRAEDLPKLMKSYDIGRGAYIVTYLLRGDLVGFLKGIAALRWRIHEPRMWLVTPLRELQGAGGYLLARLRAALG